MTNIFSTEDHAAATSTHCECAAVFSWEGERLEEDWVEDIQPGGKTISRGSILVELPLGANPTVQ